MREMTSKEGGFYLYGEEHEQLIIRPKETYDGAVFSGNSAMAYNLVQLYYLTSEKRYEEYAKRQLAFMSAEAKHHPVGFSMFLIALSDFLEAPDKITIVWNGKENLTELPCRIPIDTIVRVLEKTTEEYPLKNGRTTFYVCKGHTCLPPENELML